MIYIELFLSVLKWLINLPRRFFYVFKYQYKIAKIMQEDFFNMNNPITIKAYANSKSV